MSTNNLLKDWWRYKAKKMAPEFDLNNWFRMQSHVPAELERDLVCAMADGLLYGNWPWVKIPPDLIK